MPIEFSQEVRGALEHGRAVVALESTLICHGFPRPENLAVGQALEAAVRAAGAVPATIAILKGKVRVGLGQLAMGALAGEEGVAKCTVRDLPAVLASGKSGATTVAATMHIATLAGIRVFATGGIGGVHRGGEASLDVSADLPQLARSPVVVVCAGAKSVLDLPRTMEVLETQGVPVIGYRTSELPSFYSPHSGLRLQHRADDVAQLAAIARAHHDLRLPGGMLVCQAVAAEFALDGAVVDDWIRAALAEAELEGVRGPAVTPFLLRRLEKLSGGRTLRANRALAIANAKLAGELAVALAASGS
ncbi:MAG: pseudouridine-5'-phosphate glycosidase [Myxococcota bacterium]